MKQHPDVFFISGSMFGSKSLNLIRMIRSARMCEFPYLVFKPTNDTRDGLFVKSRATEEQIPALPWNVGDPKQIHTFIQLIQNFGLDARPKYVFIDEIHFLSEDEIKEIYRICRVKGVVLVVAGLETDFKQNDFPAAMFIKDVTKFYEFNHGRCYKCDMKTAVYNILFDKEGNIVKEGETIQPGDEEYNVVCEDCFE